MTSPRVIIFPVTPFTWIPFQSSSTVLFRIPEVCQSRHRVTGNDEDKGRSCDMYSEENPFCKHYDEEKKKWINHTLSKDGRYRKRRIENYIAYKDELRDIAEKKGFVFPRYGLKIGFYLPCPARWTKAKKRHSHLTRHEQTPDLSNLLKSFEDALMPQDKWISGYGGLDKFWVNFDQGWIETTIPSSDEL